MISQYRCKKVRVNSVAKAASSVLIALLFASLPSSVMAQSRPNYNDIDYYNCSGKPDGNYVHPFDCTRFMVCHNGHASDMACADCDPANPDCEGSRFTIYKQSVDQCDWPKVTECPTAAK